MCREVRAAPVERECSPATAERWNPAVTVLEAEEPSDARDGGATAGSLADHADEDARERAFQQAMLFLSYRARSESEIRQNLRKHEIPGPVIEQTLERLRQDGLANDRQFARTWVENRSAFRPRSRRLMAMELRQKGLAEEAVSSAVAGVDDESLAYEAAQKRVSRLKGLEWVEFRKKLSDFLARRGFSYSVIAPVVTRIWNEAHKDEQHYEEED